MEGQDIVLSFRLNSFVFTAFRENDVGILRFLDAERFRLGATNDEGFYRGHCRFSGIAPAWGEFYQISGPVELLVAPTDWTILRPASGDSKHYLFYFRDETFECVAERCTIEQTERNALRRLGKRFA